MKTLKSIVILIGLLFNTTISSSQKIIKLNYQNDDLIKPLGIGLLQSIKVDEKITLYSDNTLKKIKYKNAKIGKDIIPLIYKTDYGLLFFTCLEKNNKYCKIALKDNSFAYIKTSNNLKFFSWQEFLKNEVISIESKDFKKNPFRETVNGKPLNPEEFDSDDEQETLFIKKDWICVKNTTKNKVFWVRWKDQNKLLIYLNLLM